MRDSRHVSKTASKPVRCMTIEVSRRRRTLEDLHLWRLAHCRREVGKEKIKEKEGRASQAAKEKGRKEQKANSRKDHPTTRSSKSTARTATSMDARRQTAGRDRDPKIREKEEKTRGPMQLKPKEVKTQ